MCLSYTMRNMSEIRVENIEAAFDVIDPVFKDTPNFSDAALMGALGQEVVLKLEMFNPVRSFKGRGASFYMSQLEKGQQVVSASAGNFGQAIAYAGSQRGIGVTVYCAENANPVKVERMKELGAHVIQTGRDFDAAKEAARAHAAEEEAATFVEDGAVPGIAEGAGTIGVELAEVAPEAVLLPVGNGALATGVGCWLKAHSPQTKVIGVSAAGAPAMAQAWQTGRPIAAETVDTIADGVAVRVPVPDIIPEFRQYVDEMLLVDDQSILRALELIRDTAGLILEPSAALGIAALMEHDIPAERAATVATGSNYSKELLRRLIR